MIKCDKCGFGHKTVEEHDACKTWEQIQGSELALSIKQTDAWIANANREQGLRIAAEAELAQARQQIEGLKLVLEDANNFCQSAFSIAERKGLQTNFTQGSRETGRLAMSDKTCPMCAKPVFEDIPAELAQARQQIADKQEEVNRLLALVAKERLHAESADQQLAAAQAALLRFTNFIKFTPGYQGGYSGPNGIYDLARMEQPTGALRTFVLGLLPAAQHVEAENLRWSWNECVNAIRANLEKALGGKP